MRDSNAPPNFDEMIKNIERAREFWTRGALEACDRMLVWTADFVREEGTPYSMDRACERAVARAVAQA